MRDIRYFQRCLDVIWQVLRWSVGLKKRFLHSSNQKNIRYKRFDENKIVVYINPKNSYTKIKIFHIFKYPERSVSAKIMETTN
jgi:hypothetical protein